MSKNNKYDDFAKQLGFRENKNENSLLNNLLKPPKKDKTIDTPHTNNPMMNGSHQADLLFLPDDNGYKYALVVVDLATGKTDIKPLKSKTSKELLDAMKKIYKGKYLKQPDYLEVDAGSEFKDVFSQYYKTRLHLRVKESGRHRQQSVVETRNALVSRVLNKRMVGQEINTGLNSTEWINFLPKVIEAINDNYAVKATHMNGGDDLRGSTNALHILQVGTNVRVQLDNPQHHFTGRRLHGGFREGDIRWTKTVNPITQIYLRPDQPPMYKVGENGNVAYTKNQLQLVHANEVRPSVNLQEKHVVEKLVSRFKKDNKIYFKVKWKTGDTTDEPRTNLIKDVPLLVKYFESK